MRDPNLSQIGDTPEEVRSALIELRNDFDAHIHDGVSSRSFETITAETLSSRVISIRKTSFSDNTAGLWTGQLLGVTKLFLGTASSFLKFDGTNVSISGNLTAGSLNINNKAIIDSSGNATFIGITSLNMKSFTNFETAARFTQVVDGSGAATFTTSGLRLETTAVATSSCINKWFASQNVFNNSPTFSCSIEFGAIPTTGGVGFIGLGAPATFTGSGATFTGSHVGFEFQYQNPNWNMFATLNSGATESTTLLTSIAGSDVLDLIIKVNGTTSVDFYYRKNSGTLTKTTITATVPSSANNNIWFAMSNKGEANNIVCLVYSAALER